MDQVKLLNGTLSPKTDFTDSHKLLEHLKHRARTYRSTFGLTETEIEQNLLIENGLNLSDVQIPANLISGLAVGAALLPRKNISVVGKKLASINYSEMITELKDMPKHVVENFIPENMVSLLAGDSGIGKSPFLVQLGLSVASGLPFLGNPVTQGNVLLVDYENGWPIMTKFISSISNYLGLNLPPETFRVYHQPSSPEEVTREILLTRPKLVMIDAIRGFDPDLEDKNSKSGARLTELLHFAESENVAILLLHHLRKTSEENPPESLEQSPVMEWMQQVSGPRALVNQTATRIATERYAGKQAELILKGHFKGIGEFGPWYIGREYDESGEPVGYKRVTGLQLLSPEQAAKFPSLPHTFHFKTAESILGKGSKAAAGWLRRLAEAGLIAKHGSGKNTSYAKT